MTPGMPRVTAVRVTLKDGRRGKGLDVRTAIADARRKPKRRERR